MHSFPVSTFGVDLDRLTPDFYWVFEEPFKFVVQRILCAGPGFCRQPAAWLYKLDFLKEAVSTQESVHKSTSTDTDDDHKKETMMTGHTVVSRQGHSDALSLRMKNLFEAAAVEEVKGRMAQLTPESERLWGKMNAAQALAHCSAAMEMAIGKTRPPRILIGRMLGRMA